MTANSGKAERRERPGADSGTEGAQPPAAEGPGQSANARRVARHRAKMASSGLKQVNIQAPVAAHPILKDLGRRLKAGQPIEEALFELAALYARRPEPEPGAEPTPGGRGIAGRGIAGRLGRLFRRSGDDGSESG